MVLGDVREKTREDRAEHARQQVDSAGLFAYTHDAEPKGKHTRKAKGGLKRCLRCIKSGVNYLLEDSGVAHQELRYGKDERNDEKSYPNVIQYHIACKGTAFI